MPMQKYEMPEVLAPELAGVLDRTPGFRCATTYWQPNPADPHPEMPGRKVHVASFIPMLRDEACLCGSGKLFGKCCLSAPERTVLVPDPGEPGYSPYVDQSARYEILDWGALVGHLMAETGLHCTDESRDRSFWVCFGDPPVDTEYGIVCYGDIEASDSNTLVVMALSDKRMHSLLDLVQGIAGECLGTPTIVRHVPPRIATRRG